MASATQLDRLRNIGIIAHIDAGKTTTTERILYYTGSQHQMGTVDEGNTTTDFNEQEARRGITIFSACVQVAWAGHRINIIDTPGHVDFTAEVERSLRVLDGAVVVFDGVAGVQAQSETVWRQADRHRVPRICFINKLDRVGADFHYAVSTIEERLGARPLPIQIPIGLEAEFVGVIDLIEQRAVYFDGDEGEVVRHEAIPDDLAVEAETYREQLLEALADHDEALFEAMIEDGEVPAELLHRALRTAVLSSALTPVLAGTALRNKGVQPVIDAVCAYLPSPLDVPPVTGTEAHTGKSVELGPDPKGTPLVYAFKTASDQHGEITYLRVYSGTVTQGQQVTNPRAEKVERLQGLCRMHGSKPEKLDQASAGEIIAVRGLRFTVTGDTLCLKKSQIVLEGLDFPDTVVSMSIEPRTSGERDKLESVLAKLAKDDPTFRTYIDADTGQLIVSGMGELHLDVLKTRMLEDFKVDCVVGKPRVSYKETIRAAADGEGTFDRKVGEKQLFATVRVRVEPCDETELQFANAGVVAPAPLLKVMQEAALGAASGGPMAGFPLIRVKITLLAADWGEEDAEQALPPATSKALAVAMQRAGECLLEPIMRLEVETPEASLGDVLGDLQARRAEITTMAQNGSLRLVGATVPISTMFGYASQLRSLTAGRGSWAMEPHDFREAPNDVVERYTI